MKVLKNIFEFDWDEANFEKNWAKHKVKDFEAEEVFFDVKKVIYKDALHSQKEARFVLLGKTKKGRVLFVVFTLRKNKIRIISARDINKKEIEFYAQKIENTEI